MNVVVPVMFAGRPQPTRPQNWNEEHLARQAEEEAQRARTRTLPLDQAIQGDFASANEEHIIEFSIDLTREYNIMVEGDGLTIGQLEVEHNSGFLGMGREFRRYTHDSIRRSSVAGGGVLIAGILTHGGVGQEGRGRYRIKLSGTRANVGYSARLEMHLDVGVAPSSDYFSVQWKPREIVGANRMLDQSIMEKIFIPRERVYSFYGQLLDDSFIQRQSDIVQFFMDVAMIGMIGTASVTRAVVERGIRGLAGMQRIEAVGNLFGVGVYTLVRNIERAIPNITIREIFINGIRNTSGLVIYDLNEGREPEAKFGLIVNRQVSALAIAHGQGGSNMTLIDRWDNAPKLEGVRGRRDVNSFDIRRNGGFHPMHIQLT